MPIGGVPAPTHWQETCLDIHMWLISNLLRPCCKWQDNSIKAQYCKTFSIYPTKPTRRFLFLTITFITPCKNMLIPFNSFPPRFNRETMTKRARSAEHQEKCHTVPLNAEMITLRTSWVWHPPSSALIGRGPLPLSFLIGCWYPRAGRRGLYK